ncbi:MAG TPA: hypothetical protein VHH33_04985 [Nitrososphaeraceae archaeon]|nr:hypothetical protein [Nitrososphaeraceae archaeon]
MRTDNRMLVSTLLLLIASSCLTIFGNDALILAQETTPRSTEATYVIESGDPGDPDAFEDSAKIARDSALELIEEAIQRPTEVSNSSETANVEFTDEFGGAAMENLIGASAAKDSVKAKLDNIIDELVGNSTSLSFKMKIDTECTPPDCLFKIYLQK